MVTPYRLSRFPSGATAGHPVATRSFFSFPELPLVTPARPGGGRTEAARVGLLLGRQKLGSGDDFQWIAAMSCSATHDTPTQNQVVYESFSTGFSTKLRCLLGVGSGARSSAPRSSHVRLSAPEAPEGVPAIPGRSKGSALRYRHVQAGF
ncbi:basic proline-rich [Labeo rohita]|uniref:Basic proline-rich n=1 Tax=Labeo rohita TaxID=84645 RepID=A0A498M746_LABRO|nr:basic proline-rich [Labeo rohita]